jgi:sulfatase modifying factor 1
MNRSIAALLLGALYLGAFQAASAVTIDTVPIGNPNNPVDAAPSVGGTCCFGSVSYTYRIGKYDVTIGQYTAFLNAVAATDTYGLYNTSMATDLNIAGISRNRASGSYSYSVIGSPNHPITYVSWGDAARFSNWLNNGQPTGAEGPGTTETGAYTLAGAISDAALSAVSRNVGAKWFIPSENEWYKAAYYDAVAGHYWSFATGTYAAPTSAPPGSAPNTANFFDNINLKGFAVTGSTSHSSSQNYLTDVGAFTASASPYGTFDQSGDVYQWSETLISGSFRGARGGSWGDTFPILSATWRNGTHPTGEDSVHGFRVATVPEPSTAVLSIVVCGLTWILRKRFR